MLKNKWKIVNEKTESNWIEEEEFLLNWAENPKFEKTPLSNIQVTFIYVGNDHNIVGVTKTTIDLKIRERSSLLDRSEVFEQIDHARHPNTLFEEDQSRSLEWLNKSYIFYEAVIYSIPDDPDNVDKYDMKTTFDPLHFVKDTIKINSTLDIFQDLYEIVVIMQQENDSYTLKSILKDGTKINRTKKVQISEELPKEYLFSKRDPVSRKRKTRKTHHTNPF
jgi:hypothetical protein